MCGIAGFIDLKKSPRRQVLVSQLETIVHRGPDARGIFIDSYAALGVQRLAIIDLKTGDQPLYNEDRTLVTIFNGEIYNYQDLRKKLLQKGHILTTQSDTETLVHLFEEYGQDMPKFLNGMFVFAIWNTKKKELFIARDQFGVKPLYYFHRGPLLVFGSEIKTILSHPQVKRSINPSAIAGFARYGYVPGDVSIFAHIYKLQPGMSLHFSQERITLRQFLTLSIPDKIEDASLEKMLFEAVQYQSIADVPVGVFLSGGLDSSLLLYYLKKIQKKRIHTFSVSFAENSFDESDFARTVSQQLGSTHHETKLTSKDIVTLLPKITKKLDEPLADPSLFPTYKVSQLAQKFVKVVLSGDGGDELFGGYPTYQGHLLAQRLPHFLKPLLKSMQKIIGMVSTDQTNFPIVEVARVFLTGTFSSPLERHLTWMQRLFADAHDMLKPEFRQLESENIICEVKDLPTDMIGKVQALDIVTYLRDSLLVKADRASMFNSLELRVPYLDPGLLSYAFSLKQHEKVDIFQTKKPLRDLAVSLFPQEIWRRKKKGFSIPLVFWMSTTLLPLIKDSIQQEALYDYFDRNKVETIYEEFQNKHTHARSLWTVFMFSNWLQEWGNV